MMILKSETKMDTTPELKMNTTTTDVTLKLKLQTTGRELELTLDEARELKAALVGGVSMLHPDRPMMYLTPTRDHVATPFPFLPPYSTHGPITCAVANETTGQAGCAE